MRFSSFLTHFRKIAGHLRNGRRFVHEISVGRFTGARVKVMARCSVFKIPANKEETY